MTKHLEKFTSTGTDEMVLLSIHPEHASKILSGEKKFEFRRVWATRPVSSIAIYVTVPLKKIVGIASVRCVHRGSLRSIWETADSIGSGLTKQEFTDYFDGKSVCFAIEIKDVYRFPTPISPHEFIENFRAPQSFAYVPAQIQSSLWEEFRSQVDRPGRSLYFVGGVHGVGKTTMCKEFARGREAIHVGAGEIIKNARRSNCDDSDKTVVDVDENQRLLIAGIKKLSPTAHIILDGHFSVFNSKYEPTPIKTSIFSDLGITGIIVIVGSPAEIARRIAERDGKSVATKNIAALQRLELKRGKEVARELGVPFIRVIAGDGLAFAAAISAMKSGGQDSRSEA